MTPEQQKVFEAALRERYPMISRVEATNTERHVFLAGWDAALTVAAQKCLDRANEHCVEDMSDSDYAKAEEGEACAKAIESMKGKE